MSTCSSGKRQLRYNDNLTMSKLFNALNLQLYKFWSREKLHPLQHTSVYIHIYSPATLYFMHDKFSNICFNCFLTFCSFSFAFACHLNYPSHIYNI